MVTFANYVNNGSIYDLKVQREWQTTISYDNIVMEGQDIGNFHFGYIGRSMGYSTEFLIAGAGTNQLIGKRKNALWCFTPSLCDDPRDAYYIRMGAIAYDKQN